MPNLPCHYGLYNMNFEKQVQNPICCRSLECICFGALTVCKGMYLGKVVWVGRDAKANELWMELSVW